MPLRYFRLRRRLFRAMFQRPDRERTVLLVRWNRWWYSEGNGSKDFALLPSIAHRDN